MYLVNGPAMKKNRAVLNDLPGDLYTREANEKSTHYCKDPAALIQAVENQKETNTGLIKLLKLKVGAKVILNNPYCIGGFKKSAAKVNKRCIA